MSDSRLAMNELRFLDAKRAHTGLTPEEEQRRAELRAYFGLDAPAPVDAAPQGYYADDGNWYPYPESYAAEGQDAAPAYGADPHAYPSQGYDPSAYGDPAEYPAGEDPAPYGQGVDPAGYEQQAPGYGYDPSASEAQASAEPQEVLEVSDDEIIELDSAEVTMLDPGTMDVGPAAPLPAAALPSSAPRSARPSPGEAPPEWMLGEASRARGGASAVAPGWQAQPASFEATPPFEGARFDAGFQAAPFPPDGAFQEPAPFNGNEELSAHADALPGEGANGWGAAEGEPPPGALWSSDDESSPVEAFDEFQASEAAPQSGAPPGSSGEPVGSPPSFGEALRHAEARDDGDAAEVRTDDGYRAGVDTLGEHAPIGAAGNEPPLESEPAVQVAPPTLDAASFDSSARDEGGGQSGDESYAAVPREATAPDSMFSAKPLEGANDPSNGEQLSDQESEPRFGGGLPPVEYGAQGDDGSLAREARDATVLDSVSSEDSAEQQGAEPASREPDSAAYDDVHDEPTSREPSSAKFDDVPLHDEPAARDLGSAKFDDVPLHDEPTSREPSSTKFDDVPLHDKPTSREPSSAEFGDVPLHDEPAARDLGSAKFDDVPLHNESSSREPSSAKFDDVPLHDAPAAREPSSAEFGDVPLPNEAYSRESGAAAYDDVPLHDTPAARESGSAAYDDIPLRDAPAARESGAAAFDDVPLHNALASHDQLGSASLDDVPLHDAPAAREPSSAEFGDVPLPNESYSRESGAAAFDDVPLHDAPAARESGAAAYDDVPLHNALASHDQLGSASLDDVPLHVEPVSRDPGSAEFNDVPLHVEPVSRHPGSAEFDDVPLHVEPVSRHPGSAPYDAPLHVEPVSRHPGSAEFDDVSHRDEAASRGSHDARGAIGLDSISSDDSTSLQSDAPTEALRTRSIDAASGADPSAGGATELVSPRPDDEALSVAERRALSDDATHLHGGEASSPRAWNATEPHVPDAEPLEDTGLGQPPPFERGGTSTTGLFGEAGAPSDEVAEADALFGTVKPPPHSTRTALFGRAGHLAEASPAEEEDISVDVDDEAPEAAGGQRSPEPFAEDEQRLEPLPLEPESMPTLIVPTTGPFAPDEPRLEPIPFESASLDGLAPPLGQTAAGFDIDEAAPTPPQGSFSTDLQPSAAFDGPTPSTGTSAAGFDIDEAGDTPPPTVSRAGLQGRSSSHPAPPPLASNATADDGDRDVPPYVEGVTSPEAFAALAYPAASALPDDGPSFDPSSTQPGAPAETEWEIPTESAIDLRALRQKAGMEVPAEPDLSGSPEDAVPLAANSEFVDTLSRTEDEPSEEIELSSDDEIPGIETGPLAAIAQPDLEEAPATESLPEGDDVVPLATNADFLGSAALRGAGEPGPWTPKAEADPTGTFWNERPEAPREEPNWEEHTVEVRTDELHRPPPAAPAEEVEVEIEVDPFPARPLSLEPPPSIAPLEEAGVDIETDPDDDVDARSEEIEIESEPLEAGPASVIIEPELELEVAPSEVFTPPPAPPVRAPRAAPAPEARAAAAALAPPPRFSPPASSAGLQLELNAPARALSTTFVEGEHRVIVHTVEGLVKRGTLRDADMLDHTFRLEQQAGKEAEKILSTKVKAIFFMLPPGQKMGAPEGQKVKVTFTDGRQVAGFSSDAIGQDSGFFLVPADARTNTARIFVFRASVQSLAVE